MTWSFRPTFSQAAFTAVIALGSQGLTSPKPAGVTGCCGGADVPREVAEK